ncbi:MAG: urease accessory protein UreD [Rhizobiaceae bacterium]
MQRVRGHGVLAVHDRAGRSRLARLFQEGSAKIRMPEPTGEAFEAILINTAGGLTGGDRLRWEVDVGPRASAVITTQACEKIYKAAQGHAGMHCALRVGAGGHLAWLPQETIVFDRGAFVRRLDVELETGASALIVEAAIFGRMAHGERTQHGRFADRWRVRCGGRMVHAEDFALGPQIDATLARSAVASGATASATLLLVADDAALRLDAARALVGDAGGVSCWTVGGTGKLLARLIASDGYELRKRLAPLIELLNGGAALPKVWSL